MILSPIQLMRNHQDLLLLLIKWLEIKLWLRLLKKVFLRRLWRNRRNQRNQRNLKKKNCTIYQSTGGTDLGDIENLRMEKREMVIEEEEEGMEVDQTKTWELKSKISREEKVRQVEGESTDTPEKLNKKPPVPSLPSSLMVATTRKTLTLQSLAWLRSRLWTLPTESKKPRETITEQSVIVQFQPCLVESQWATMMELLCSEEFQPFAVELCD